jgi:HK97 family phage major capsid protein
MKLTAALKQWLVENFGVKTDANDEAFKTAVNLAVKEGKLTIEKFTELQAKSDPPTGPPATGLELLQKTLGEALKPVTERLDKLEKGNSTPAGKTPKNGKNGKGKTGEPAATKSDPDEDDDDSEDVIKSVMSGVEGLVKSALQGKKGGTATKTDDDEEDDSDDEKSFGGEELDMDNVDVVKMFTGNDRLKADGYGSVRVKEVVERFTDTKSALHHPTDSKHVHLRGQRVTTGMDGHDLDTLSERDKAVTGAWFKLMVNSALGGRPVPQKWKMNEQDNQLVLWAIHNCKFTGLIGYDEPRDEAKSRISNRKLKDTEIKAILDDSVSGGLEAAPIVFDDAFITTPLLFGELFPLVNLVNLPRGRRVEGFSIGNPTITSGTPEGTAIALFNTAGFIAAFDTTIYNAVGAMELGLDFQEDSPVGIADVVIQRYGDQFLAWLDEQVAIGDGTTEPQGVFNASGTTDVPSTNGASGPPTLADYEGLLFGVQKQFRDPQSRGRQVYISNEVTYRRSRAMKVDPQSPSGDERRLLGMDHENYMTLNHPHKINHNISNARVAFVNLRYYRMYRRLGLNVRIERGGKEMALRNVELIVVRARFGGQLELGGAMAYIDDAQS